jgi:cell division protein YceG involved in septum cleavage
VSGIGQRLADSGVVPDAFTFRIAARMSGAGLGLQAGEYRFAEPASPYDVVARIARGDVFVRPITFREGLTIKEMAPIFEKSGLGTRRSSSARRGWVADRGDRPGGAQPRGLSISGNLRTAAQRRRRGCGARDAGWFRESL